MVLPSADTSTVAGSAKRAAARSTRRILLDVRRCNRPRHRRGVAELSCSTRGSALIGRVGDYAESSPNEIDAASLAAGVSTNTNYD
jgi:hypothetical protein